MIGLTQISGVMHLQSFDRVQGEVRRTWTSKCRATLAVTPGQTQNLPWLSGQIELQTDPIRSGGKPNQDKLRW